MDGVEFMTDIVVHAESASLPHPSTSVIPVLMYGSSAPAKGAAIGHQVYERLRRLRRPVHAGAFDFLTVALAITSADTFVNRNFAEDGWAREMRVEVAVIDVAAWKAVQQTFERALRFLSGDNWTMRFVSGGPSCPVPMTRGWRTELDGCDSACLFSGGLDSAIGAIDMQAEGRSPVLVSHSYPRDGQRQEKIFSLLSKKAVRFAANAHPASKLDTSNDVQMRTRSLNFLAFGAVLAATLATKKGPSIELFVPENGFIALNPPLTARRIGALSTRTTHPHFLAMIQNVFDRLGIPVHIKNPFSCKTKGEMIIECANQSVLEDLAGSTVSCGKWKRSGQQCGKCVPCLIRRASFYAAGRADPTVYNQAGRDLRAVLAGDKGRDDVLAMVLASRRFPNEKLSRWIPMAGPLSGDPATRAALLDVAGRGMAEVRAYLGSESLL